MLAVVAPVATLAIYLVFAARAGLGTSGAARGVAVIALTQVLPGAVLWRLVRPRRGWWIEDVLMGFAVGSCLAVAAQALAGTLQAPWIAAALGPLAGAVALAWPATRRRVVRATVEPMPLLWAPATGAASLLLLLPTQGFYRRFPLVWPEGFRATYIDLPFHQSLVGQLAHRGPLEVPYVLGEPLQYHWFSHAWIAQVGVAGGIPLDAVLMRLLPAVITVVAVFAVAVAATRIAQRPWAGPLAAFLVVAAGDLDVFGSVRTGSFIAHLSPSTGLAVPLIAALLTLLAMRWRSEAGRGSAWMLVVLALAAAGMKGSALPVVVGGVLLAAAVAAVCRLDARRRVWVDGALLLAVLLTAIVVIFGGGAPGLAIDPVAATGRYAQHLGLAPDVGATSTAAALLLTLITLCGALARGAGLLGLSIDKSAARDPVMWLLVGTGLAGAGAVIAFSHTGESQWYFLRAAAPALAIGSATMLLALLDRCGSRAREALLAGLVTGMVARTLPTLLLGEIRVIEDDTSALVRAGGSLLMFLVIIAAAAYGLAAPAGVGARRNRGIALTIAVVAVLAATTGPVIAVYLGSDLPAHNAPVDATERFSFSADQIDAARHLRDISEPDDVVMTNRHCSSPVWVTCDSRRFAVTAYTERRLLVEGWAYTPRSSVRDDPDVHPAYNAFWDSDRLALNDGFLAEPDEAARVQLWRLGVRWIFVDKTVDNVGDLAGHAELVLDTEWSSVYELIPPAMG